MDLFPIIQPQAYAQPKELPLCREVAWDFNSGQPIFRNGRPVIVEGNEAVKVWIWKAILTERKRYEIYSWAFGSEVETLIGQNYSAQLKKAEAIRYVREALEVNPYITDIASISVDFDHGRLTMETTVKTVYGELYVYA